MTRLFKSSAKTRSSVRKAQLGLEALEQRDLMAGITFNAVTGIVSIYGSNEDDVANVSIVGSQVKVNLTCYADVEPYFSFFSDAKSYAVGDVTEVKFYGYDGKDKFTNSTSIKSFADGGEGNDSLSGGSGADYFIGNYGNDTIDGNGGNDTLWGSGGHDRMYGDSGRDLIKGHGGSDTMYGGTGNDSMYGGSSNDRIYGESGNDVIVTIGGGTDTITGGDHWDKVWMDMTDVITDASANEVALGYINKVGEFFAISYNGGSLTSPVPKELSGQDLADPLPNFAHTGLSIKNFKSNPLFASGGPSKNDIFQGSVGDCYFMAVLGSIADVNPEFIKKMVVDLGDGTYAVRFYEFDKNQPESIGPVHYVRVDADLWVDGTNTPKYAKLGQDGSLWVAIVEKAYAFFRKHYGNYPSIASGNGTARGHLGLVGSKTVTWEINDGVTDQQVVDWVKNGSPAGLLKNKITTGVINLLNWVAGQIASGKALTTGARSGISNMTAIQLDDPSTPDSNESTYRRGQHVYHVDAVLTDENGDPMGLRLRDPYGQVREITDFTRLYFCIGRASATTV